MCSFAMLALMMRWNCLLLEQKLMAKRDLFVVVQVETLVKPNDVQDFDYLRIRRWATMMAVLGAIQRLDRFAERVPF